jgi:hypothetical protein
MSVNSLFQSGGGIGTRPEQSIIEQLIIQAIKWAGQDIYYMPRTSVKPDRILGEDILSQFTQIYPIEMALFNVQGWDGSAELMTKFGIQITDQCTFVVSKLRWEQAVGLQTDDLQLPDRPAEGDLLYFPKTRSFFEIKFVEHLNPFYQLGKFYVYNLQAEMYNYSSETIQTIDEEINERAAQKNRNMYQWRVLTQTGGTLLTQSGGVVIRAAFPEEANSFDNTVDFEEASVPLVQFNVNDPFGEL